MRKKIRELEQKAKKANELVSYLAKRNEYLKEQFNDLYTRKHSEYYSVYLTWREESNNWFKMRDQVDQTDEEMKQNAAEFLMRCQILMRETADQEADLEKELENDEISLMQIHQFIQHEPIWQEEIEELLCKELCYDYLYTFRKAREQSNLTLVSDLLQRRMHKDFMGMAYQERRKMRRLLPSACKNMLGKTYHA